MKRGYFGIGVFHGKNEQNVGTLWRSANIMGADFIFTIGKRYSRQCTDTKAVLAHNFMDEIIELLKKQEAVELVKWIYPSDIIGFGRCPHCNSLWDYSLISNRFFKHCPRCGQAVKWK